LTSCAPRLPCHLAWTSRRFSPLATAIPSNSVPSVSTCVRMKQAVSLSSFTRETRYQMPSSCRVVRNGWQNPASISLTQLTATRPWTFASRK
jgi:hypothetical protein